MGNSRDDSSDDLKLLKQAAQGDERAFTALFDRYRSYLTRFLESRMDARLRRRFGVSDVLQETQLAVYRRLRDYLARQPMPLKLWLRKTAQERLLELREKHIESARRDVRREIPLSEHSSLLLSQQLAAAQSSPSAQLRRQERQVAIARALAELPSLDREILTMRNIEQLSYAEVARVLDVTSAAARKRYGRALLRLQKILSDLHFDAS
jgi:RNA polymerase sigma-70 factor (ECF subfamily)